MTKFIVLFLVIVNHRVYNIYVSTFFLNLNGHTKSLKFKKKKSLEYKKKTNQITKTFDYRLIISAGMNTEKEREGEQENKNFIKEQKKIKLKTWKKFQNTDAAAAVLETRLDLSIELRMKNKIQKIFFFTKTTYWIRYETKINIQFWIWIFIWFNGLLMNYRWFSSIRPVIAHLILMTKYSIKNNATSLANDMIYWLDGVCLVIHTHTKQTWTYRSISAKDYSPSSSSSSPPKSNELSWFLLLFTTWLLCI